MDTAQIVKKLRSLVQLDIDAIHAYEKAIEKIDIKKVKDQLVEYKKDHMHHVENLSAFISGYGEDVPKFSPDFKGILIEGLTAFRSITGTEGALKAMKSNEELTNKTYDEALSWELPANIRDTVQQNRDDERRHLEYIEMALEKRVWERTLRAVEATGSHRSETEGQRSMKSTAPHRGVGTSDRKLDELEEEIDQEIDEGEIVEKKRRKA